jgi:hypothetical protein
VITPAQVDKDTAVEFVLSITGRVKGNSNTVRADDAFLYSHTFSFGVLQLDNICSRDI